MKLHKYIKNVFSLGVVQGLNVLIPLFLLPYVAVKLGPESLGVAMFVQLISGFFVMVVEYGFYWHATKEISVLKVDRESLNRKFSAIVYAQILLMVASMLVYSVGVLAFAEPSMIFYFEASAISIASAGISVIWLLVGMQQIQILTKSQLIQKIILVITIIIFIKEPEDGVKYVLITNGMVFLSNATLVIAGIKGDLVSFKKIEFKNIIFELKEAKEYFFSRIAVSVYNQLTPTLLGVISGSAQLSFYSLADKLRMGIQTIQAPFLDALFPILCEKNDKKTYALIGKIIYPIYFVLYVLCASIICYFADTIVVHLFGNEFLEVSKLLRIQVWIPLIVVATNLIGVQYLVPVGRKFEFNKSIFLGALFGLLSMYPLIRYYNANGAAFTLLMSELIVLGSMAYFVLHKIPQEK